MRLNSKVMTLLFIACFFPSLAWANDNEQAHFYIQQVDSSIDVSQFKDPRIQVEKRKESTIPSVEKRDRCFESAGITSEIKDWDQLDRDLLYIRSKNISERKLFSDYPKLSQNKLRKLTRIVQASLDD